MKKTTRIITTITLVVAILLCTVWYLSVYDREFTRDILLTCARRNESNGNHELAAWFYDLAYAQSDKSDAVAIERAQQYRANGNYTKAEYTLYNAIADGGGVDLYIALSKLYIEQDKLLDAVNMLNGVTDPVVKAKLDAMRPAAPTASPEHETEKPYNQYISVELSSEDKTIYFSTDGQYPSTMHPIYSEPILLPGGETKIQALSINDKGLVSPLATFNYTIADVIELVSFNDAAIESAVRQQLNLDEDAEIYTKDLWTITEFVVPEDAKNYADLTRMSFLEKLTIANGVASELPYLAELSNVNELTIKNTSVSQGVLNGISQLPLKKLTLTGCDLSNITELGAATALTYLDLSNNAIRNITALGSMPELQELNLRENALNDLSALANNIKLITLDISHNEIITLSPLTPLCELTTLDASNNKVSNLGDISRLSALKVLKLAENNLASIYQLSKHPTLEDLDISNNLLVDINQLKTIPNLKYLNFSNNAVTELPTWNEDAQLVSINGSNNNLFSLDGLRGLENLNIVDVQYNELIDSVAPLTKCPVLMQVYVFGTAVTDVDLLRIQGIVVSFDPFAQ